MSDVVTGEVEPAGEGEERLYAPVTRATHRRRGQCGCFGYVYVVRRSDGLYKIGTTVTFRERIQRYNAVLPEPVTVVAVAASREAADLERSLHHAFRSYRIRGEWSRFDDDTLQRVVAMCDAGEAPQHTEQCLQPEPPVTSGEVVEAEGEGNWLSLREAARVLGLGEKAVYMQGRRHKRPWKKDDRGRVLVWVTEVRTNLPPVDESRNLAVPSAEMFRTLVEQTAAPLVTRIEEVVRENERLQAEVERLQAALQPVEERPSWWRRLLGYN